MRKLFLLAVVVLGACSNSPTAPQVKRQHELYYEGQPCNMNVAPPDGWLCTSRGLTPVGG